MSPEIEHNVNYKLCLIKFYLFPYSRPVQDQVSIWVSQSTGRGSKLPQSEPQNVVGLHKQDMNNPVISPLLFQKTFSYISSSH